MTYIDDLARDIRRRLPPKVLPASVTDDLFRLYALIGMVKGESVTSRDVHDAWVVWMTGRGEKHRSMVPFAELSKSVQRQDNPFVTAIRDAVAAHGER